MLEVTQQDYVRTAWAKGLDERRVILRHTVRNGIIPVVTLGVMTIPRLIGGAVLVENVFNIPGMGRLATEALFSQDYAIVQGIVLIVAIIVVVSNLAVEVSYGWIDPRIRHS
jgi:peptide/nickel transport system permease protein